MPRGTEWAVCSRNPETCTSAQTSIQNAFLEHMVKLVKGSKQFETPGNGFFIHSCFTHCEGLGNNYLERFAINGTTMQAAVSQWWDNWKEGGSSHLPCELDDSPGAGKKACNPTCIDGIPPSVAESVDSFCANAKCGWENPCRTPGEVPPQPLCDGSI